MGGKKVSSEMIGFLGIIILFVLLFVRLPVGFAMILVGLGGIFVLSGFNGAFAILKTTPYTTIANYGFSVIPLFILLGELAYQGGMTTKLYSSAYKLVGHLRAGLAMATLLACGVFAAISGSSVATAGAMGKVAIPDMKKFNYEPNFSAATVVAGGSLGILIPPSVIAVIYAILTEQAVGKVLLALFIPGILLLTMFIITALILTTIKPEIAPKGERHSAKEQIKAFIDIVPILLVFIVIIGGIYLGFFTASEAAGVGAFIVLIYGIVTRNMTVGKFFIAIKDACSTCAISFVILIGAMVMNYFLAISGLPMALSNWIGSLGFHPYIVFIFIILIYFILGCVMDSMSILTLTVPIMFPIILKLGFDPIWFGVMMVVFVETALITPPVGMVLYVVKSISEDIKMEKLMKAVIPYIICVLIFTAIIFFIPDIVLWLPNHMK